MLIGRWSLVSRLASFIASGGYIALSNSNAEPEPAITSVDTFGHQQLSYMKDPRELPEDLRRAIVAIKPVQVGDETRYECKFADKQRALDSLARHLQMFKDMVIVENVFRIVNEMDDDELDRRLAELERALGKAKTLDPASVH